jgi:hypothetical protein
VKLKDRLFKKLAYQYSKDRIEQIEAINEEIKRCEEDIENTKKADSFACSQYLAGNDYYQSQSYMIKRILFVGLKAYKEELINKKNKLL